MRFMKQNPYFYLKIQLSLSLAKKQQQIIQLNHILYINFSSISHSIVYSLLKISSQIQQIFLNLQKFKIFYFKEIQHYNNYCINNSELIIRLCLNRQSLFLPKIQQEEIQQDQFFSIQQEQGQQQISEFIEDKRIRMQKQGYLKYFKKKTGIKKQYTDQSFQNSLINFQDIHEQQRQSPTNGKLFESKKNKRKKSFQSQKMKNYQKIQRKTLQIPTYKLYDSQDNFQKQQKRQKNIQNKKQIFPLINQQNGTNKNNATQIEEQTQNNSSILKWNSMHSPSLKTDNIGSNYLNSRVKTLESTTMFSTQQKMYQPIRPYDRNKTAPNKKFRTLKSTFADLNSSCRNYNDVYTISLQNQRMGWRIMNTRSMIQQYLNSTNFTYHMYNGNLINRDKYRKKQTKQKRKINFNQINNLVKVFFNQNTLKNMSPTKSKNIFQGQKQTNEVQQYILKQNRSKINSLNKIKQTDKQISLKNKIQDNVLNKENIGHSSFHQKSNKIKTSKGSFFRSTYRKTDKSFNIKPCQEQNIRVSKNRIKKAFRYNPKVNYIQTEPGNTEQIQQKYCVLQNQIFGKGPLVIQLRNLQIISNPPIKNNEVLMFQLVENHNSELSQQYQNKIIRTIPFQYNQLKKGIKFAVNLKAGDFIPLKLWRYHGLSQIQIGIIDLNLLIYKDKKKYFESSNEGKIIVNQNPCSLGIQQMQLFRQQKQNATNYWRQIVFFKAHQKLRKNKKPEIQSTVKFDCMIYSKKFNKMSKDTC